MNHLLLGHSVCSRQTEVELTPELENTLKLVIDTVTSSKLSLLDFIKKNPNLSHNQYDEYLCQECTSIAYVNDALSIGLPMNSLRFTLRTALSFYSNSIVPYVEVPAFRHNAFERFIHEYQEVLLVFPTVFGRTLHVGDLTFTVKSLNNKPTFVEFVKRDLSTATLFYSTQKSSIEQLSEFRK